MYLPHYGALSFFPCTATNWSSGSWTNKSFRRGGRRRWRYVRRLCTQWRRRTFPPREKYLYSDFTWYYFIFEIFCWLLTTFFFTLRTLLTFENFCQLKRVLRVSHAINTMRHKFSKSTLCSEFYIANKLGHWLLRICVSIKIDWYLWEEGERSDRAGTLPPHHRTLTTFY